RLDGGWALKLTTGKWFTPSGRTIQRPRKLTSDGRLVVDSIAIRDDSIKGKPVFHSDAGRIVYGGGGITPDVEVKPDTATAAEKAFMTAIAPKAQQTYRALNDYAVQARGSLSRDFTVTPAMREAFFQRLTAAGVPVTRAQYESVTPLINRLLEDKLSTVAFGDSAAFRRGIDQDQPLRRALTLLRGVQSQQALFARAAAETARPQQRAAANVPAVPGAQK
ncbi:MAG TPA: hypothetical protein VFH27_16435, partial [Longimicrobiaceae bacterium]|nr:hypothetical protein [Longimicrobiaceae bacterium]